MSSHRTRISQLILDQLARGEMRLLVLVVAVRRRLGRFESIKGDLSDVVQGALRQLIAAKAVVEVEGVYGLPKKPRDVVMPVDEFSAAAVSSRA